jgi:hypothetical protein
MPANSKLSMTILLPIQGSEGRKSLQLFDAQEYEHLAVRWKKRKDRKEDQEHSDFEFLQASIYLSQ